MFKQNDIVKCKVCGIQNTVDAVRTSDAGFAFDVVYFKDGTCCPLIKECIKVGVDTGKGKKK